MPKKIRHIAVIRLSAMGDVAMTVPTLLAFQRSYPDIRITIVSREFFRPIFEKVPNAAFFAADTEGRHKGIFGLSRLKSELLHLNVDAVIDLHNVIRSKIITLFMRFSGIPTSTIDKARAEKKALTRPNNKIFKPLSTVRQRHADAFAKLGFPIEFNPPVFLKTLPLTPHVTNVTGTRTVKWLGIAPFAKHASKIYPMDLMRQVINGFADKNIKIFLFGSGDREVAVLRDFAGENQNIVVPGGKLSFAEELVLISNLNAMLSMDSANAHLAAMYGIPVITLWGATHPYAGFAPFNQPFENALVSDRTLFPDLPTSIYGNKQVKGYEDAMSTIPPEAVIAKVLKIVTD